MVKICYKYIYNFINKLFYIIKSNFTPAFKLTILFICELIVIVKTSPVVVVLVLSILPLIRFVKSASPDNVT